MFLSLKRMIARCIEQMQRGACADCERRDSCVFHSREGIDFGSRIARSGGGSAALEQTPWEAFLERFAEGMTTSRPAGPSFKSRVERQIENMLEEGSVRIDEVARSLGVSRQTLYRRLKAEGVTFEAILDRLRRRLALKWLSEGLSVKGVAYRLGFSDPAAFSRAFKRWTGSSPSTRRRP